MEGQDPTQRRIRARSKPQYPTPLGSWSTRDHTKPTRSKEYTNSSTQRSSTSGAGYTMDFRTCFRKLVALVSSLIFLALLLRFGSRSAVNCLNERILPPGVLTSLQQSTESTRQLLATGYSKSSDYLTCLASTIRDSDLSIDGAASYFRLESSPAHDPFDTRRLSPELAAQHLSNLSSHAEQLVKAIKQVEPNDGTLMGARIHNASLKLSSTWYETKSRLETLLFTHRSTIQSIKDHAERSIEKLNPHYEALQACRSVRCLWPYPWVEFVSGRRPPMSHIKHEIEDFAKANHDIKLKELQQQVKDFERSTYKEFRRVVYIFVFTQRYWMGICFQESQGIWGLGEKKISAKKDASDSICRVDIDKLSSDLLQYTYDDVRGLLFALERVPLTLWRSYGELLVSYNSIMHILDDTDSKAAHSLRTYMWVFDTIHARMARAMGELDQALKVGDVQL